VLEQWTIESADALTLAIADIRIARSATDANCGGALLE
jgi:hypothetical protein